MRETKTEHSRSIGKKSIETQAIIQRGINGVLNEERIRLLPLGDKMAL